MKVLITGGTGLIGQHLISKLKRKHIDFAILTRSPSESNEFKWDIKQQYIDENAFENVTHLVHLAGAGIADKRWTESRKKVLYNSRIDSTNLLLKYIENHNIPLDSYVGGSASGYYGNSEDEKFDENSSPGNDFLANITIDWEKAHNKLQPHTKKHTIIRTGIVLSNDGGALKSLALPIKYYIGAPVGSGKQYISWIHINDLVELFYKSLFDDNYSGIINGCAPNPVTNEKMTEVIAKELNKPLFLPNVPGFMLKLLLGEFSQFILYGAHVTSNKLKDKGFEFKFPNIETTIKDLL